MSVILHGETIQCSCSGELEFVPMEGSSVGARFAFDITHKRNGEPIKNLETKGPFLGVIIVVKCTSCKEYSTVFDTVDDPTRMG